MEHTRPSVNRPCIAEPLYCHASIDSWCPRNTDYPLFMAEELCIRSFARLREPRMKTVHSCLGEAWDNIEAGLCTKGRQARTHLEAADTSLRSAHRIGGSGKESMQTELLLAYMPVFEERQTGALPQRPSAILQEVGGVFARAYEQHDNNMQGFAAEILTLYLLLYSDDPAYFAYPAAPREEANEMARFNHDLYILRKQERTLTKIPLQVKKAEIDAKYDVPVLALREVCADAWQCGYDQKEACYQEVCQAAMRLVTGNGTERDRTIAALMSRAVCLYVERGAAQFELFKTHFL